jgi:flagellar assembly factor FliW
MGQAARQEVAAGSGLTVVVAGGLVGMPRVRRFALERSGDAATPFHLLVNLDGAGSCFVVADADALWPAYAAEVRAAAGGDAGAVLAILTPRPGATTANLLSPLVVDLASGAARQLVLEGSSWSTRHPL